MEQNKKVEMRAIVQALSLVVREYVKSPSEEVAQIIFDYLDELRELTEETMPKWHSRTTTD